MKKTPKSNDKINPVLAQRIRMGKELDLIRGGSGATAWVRHPHQMAKLMGHKPTKWVWRLAPSRTNMTNCYIPPTWQRVEIDDKPT